MSGRIEKTVFISYRRTNFWTALAVYKDLTSNGFDVFFDYKNIPSGDFAQAITENIRSRAHFIIILSSSALERCSEPGDWLRREIELAIDNQRNIIPLVMEGFEFSSVTTEKALTGKLNNLKMYNAIGIPAEYFDEAMDKLRSDRFLKRSLESVSHPISDITKTISQNQKLAADKAKSVEPEQLTAEEWFERGFVFYEDKKFNDAIQCYSEAIKLIPGYAGAYNNRGNIYSLVNKTENAIQDYTKAIDLDPNYTIAYSNRSVAWIDNGEWDKAIHDLDKAIQLDPDYANAYVNRGMSYQRLGNLDEAIRSYDKAIEIIPQLASAYNKRGTAKEKKNDINGALEDYNFAIIYIYREEEYLPYHNRGRIYQNKGKLEEALSDYNKSILLNPEYLDNYFNRGLVWEKKENYYLAIEDFQKYLELSGNIKSKKQKDAEEKIKLLKRKIKTKKK